jgi:HAD superfamily hydrolase (TIGR01509 family)
MTFDYLNGFLPFLSDLRANGVKTAVVTSSNQPKMESVYRNHPEFKSLFDAILTSEDFSESKPSPDCYLKAAKRLDVSPSQCMVFEDSFNGLRSGCAAKMFVVGITTTNPATAIRELSNLQVADYTELSFNKLELIFNL